VVRIVRRLAVVATLVAVVFAAPDMKPLTASAAGGAAADRSPAGGRPAPAERGAGGRSDGLVVRLSPDANVAAIQALVAAGGAVELGRLEDVRTLVLGVAPERRGALMRKLRGHPGVARVEVDRSAEVTLVPNDPLWSKQWGMRKVRGPAAWDVATGANGPIIAVLDTGVARNHPDLRGRVLAGWDFVNNDSDPADDNGHGTAVAGIAAGAGNNGVGVAGMCWGCRILPVKVANSNGRVLFSNVAAGIVWAANRGASVINLSLGSTGGSSALADAVRHARSKGAVIVASAGNTGKSELFYPAAYPGVISVAATTSSDTLYNFSTRGSWVRVAAPGCAFTSKPGGTWDSFCGTSASAPIVAGAAALLRTVAPNATRSAVASAITGTAVRFTSAIGGGRLDTAAALGALAGSAPDAAPAPTPTPTPTPDGGVPASGEVTFEGRLTPDDWSRSRKIALGGQVRIDARWRSSEDVRITLRNADGKLVARMGGDDDDEYDRFRDWLKPGTYRLRVRQLDDGWTRFEVRVRWER